MISRKQTSLEYPEAIRDMVVIDERTIFFMHASRKTSITRYKFDTFKIFIDGKVKPVRTKGTIYRSPFDVIFVE